MESKKSRGRPFKSYKYSIGRKKVPLETFKKYVSAMKKDEDLKKLFLNSRGIELSSLKIDKTISERIDDVLEELNNKSIIPITKKQFVKIAVERFIKEIEAGKTIGLTQ